MKKVKNIIEKYKTLIIIFLIGFIFYFVLGIILSYYLNTYNFWNALFDLDTPRVFGDLSIMDFNHYRVAVHPLFVIFFQPIVKIINLILKNYVVSCIFLQCIFSSISLVCIYVITNKITSKKNISLITSVIFGFCFNQIVFSSAIETYIFAQGFLTLLWLFVVFKIDKKFGYWDYIILTLLGVCSLAVTITNFFQFIIIVFFLIMLNKKIEKRFLTGIIIIGLSAAISVCIAELQGVIWPSAPNFFSTNLQGLLTMSSEEGLYISKKITLNNFLNVINSNFAWTFNIFNLKIATYVKFSDTIISNIFSIVAFIIFISLNILFIIKTKFNIKDHKYYYALIVTYCFNFCLHILYGNNIAFIYTCHYNFIIILLLVYILNYFEWFKNIKNKYLYIIGIITGILSIRSIILLFKLIFPIYSLIEKISIASFLIIMIVLIIIILLMFKKNKIKILFIILICASLFSFYALINKKYEVCEDGCSGIDFYKESFNNYTNQLNKMKSTLGVEVYSDRSNTPLKIFYFGMVDRKKILYKDGKLIDIKTHEVIKEFDYVAELIVPNEYTVILEDENKNIYKIYENETGIYIDTNSQIEVLELGKQKLELPEFDTNEYSEILKVLYQEILFNIDGTIPKPNLIGYDEAWYRDTMLATMVLEYTNNTELLIPWVKSIESIYDYSRSKDIKETDNLGELLYIISAVGVNRDDLVQEIIDEINDLKDEDGLIGGSVDGTFQRYYPTVLAKNAAEKMGIEIDLNMPVIDDAYAKLTWYYHEKPAYESTMESKIYPYLNWAFYHYAGYGKLFILDEIYPLSYEASHEYAEPNEKICFISKYYCEQPVHLSHLWHASEMFLVLKDYEVNNNE